LEHILSPSRCRNGRPVARTPPGGLPRPAGIAAHFSRKSAPRKRPFCAFALGTDFSYNMVIGLARHPAVFRGGQVAPRIFPENPRPESAHFVPLF
jgi:hypothetical protein